MKCVRNYILCIHNSTMVGRGGWGLHGLSFYFPRFTLFHIRKGVQVIIGLKLNTINIVSNVEMMLKHIIFYRKGLVIILKKWFKRLMLSS